MSHSDVKGGAVSGKKAISTVDLLRKQKQMHLKMRKLSQSSGDEPNLGEEEPAFTMQNAMSMPVLPTLGGPSST